VWIERDIAETIRSNTDPVQVIRGPRQCGKTSLLLRLDPEFKELSLDDPALRELAQNDPELFLSQFDSMKLFIDEAHHAPALFPSLKRMVDLYKREHKGPRRTILRLTGSNQIMMDRSVKESLAGRASFFDMNTLSVAEILNARPVSIQNIIYTGGWPELHATGGRDPKKYLDDYINSYIEKDIVLAAGIHKSREFLKCLRLLAGRTGEILDLAGLGTDAGVDAKTIKEWVSVLERMHVLALVMPFSSNLSSRLIKSPKVYFLDTGIACRLQGWTSPEPILTSPQQGHLFENLVFAELYKLIINHQLGWQLFHWRSRDGEEIDFVIQRNPGDYMFLEAKTSPPESGAHAKYPEFKKVFGQSRRPIYTCHQEGKHILPRTIPIAKLKEFLLDAWR